MVDKTEVLLDRLNLLTRAVQNLAESQSDSQQTITQKEIAALVVNYRKIMSATLDFVANLSEEDRLRYKDDVLGLQSWSIIEGVQRDIVKRQATISDLKKALDNADVEDDGTDIDEDDTLVAEPEED